MTTIWSPLPVGPATAAEVQETCLQASDAGFTDLQPLPWALEDLAGSLWREVFTGWLATARVERNAENLPVLAWTSAFYHGDDLGHWHRTPRRPWKSAEHPGQYMIAHWVRADHLRVELQLTWCRVETEWVEAEIADSAQRLRNTRLRRLLTERIAGLQARREQLLAEAQALARQHHITFDLTAGAVVGAGVQLHML